MSEEEPKVETPVAEAAPETPAPAATPSPVEATKDVTDEKKKLSPDHVEEKVDDSKAITVVDKPPEAEKTPGGSADRDTVYAQLETEKRMSLIKAWEENEKTKAENKAHKKLSTIGSWENTKKAAIEAKLKQIEEQLEKKKAEYGEQMKNKIAMIHKEAEEKRAMTEAKRGEEFLKAEEFAAKYRATGLGPKKLLGCFGG